MATKKKIGDLQEFERPERKDDVEQQSFFDIGPDWEEHWWGMPAFEQKDVRPSHTISMNFMTKEDVKEFAKKLGINATHHSNSAWYPPQKRLSGQFKWVGDKTKSKYPVCIPSKGRADVQLTGKVLDKLGVTYKFFVEETEYDEYCKHLGKRKVVKMPFHDLGKGSVPGRNFIWEWAKERGHKRHWTMDDNIGYFARCHNNRRINVEGGRFFNVMEDFVDRYENIAMAGPHHKGFVIDRDPNLSPYLLNSRVYSCILLDTSLPHRWRGRYSEDTDLSLRLLKDGYCTMLFKALMMHKDGTHSGGNKKSKALKGGNTDNVYNTNDFRKAFAISLQKQHPDIVQVVWKSGRWHHQVDYSRFKRNKLVLKEGITANKLIDEYGMEFKRAKE